MAAERLHLVDVGDLEGQERKDRDADDRSDVIPFEAVVRQHIGDVHRETDQRYQGQLDHPHGAGEHDRRVGDRQMFVGGGLGALEELAGLRL